MLNRYRDLLALPGAIGFVVPGLIARFPIAMRPLGTLLLVLELTGSYRLAGATSAALTISQVVATPRLGRLADRYGQRRLLRLTVVAHSAGLALLIVAAQLSAPAWVLLATAALAGAAVAPVPAMVLARWTRLVASARPDDVPGALGRVYALESMLGEIVFIVGPFVVTALALGVFPAAGLLVAIALVVVGGLGLASQTGSEPPPSGTAGIPGAGAMRTAGLRVVVLTFVGSGVIVGAGDVALVAFADEAGRRGVAALLLPLFAVGSLIAALLYGSRDWQLSPERRFTFAVAGLLLGTIPLVLAPNLVVMAIAAIVAGGAIAPATIAGYALVARLVAPASLTEAFAWSSTAGIVGLAIGSAVAGQVVDGSGSRAAFVVAIVGGTAATLIVVAGGRWLRTEPATAAANP